MILHFSHIGLTDGRTFMIPFEACGFDDPDGEALETGAVAATIPRSGLLHADGPLDLSATEKYNAGIRVLARPLGAAGLPFGDGDLLFRGSLSQGGACP